MIKEFNVFCFIFLLVVLLERANSWCWKTQFADSSKINSIDFSRDGSKIVTASDSNLVIVWDAHTLEQLFVYNLGVKAYTAKFSKDSSMIVIGGAQPNMHVLSVPAYTTLTTTLSGGTQT